MGLATSLYLSCHFTCSCNHQKSFLSSLIPANSKALTAHFLLINSEIFLGALDASFIVFSCHASVFSILRFHAFDEYAIKFRILLVRYFSLPYAANDIYLSCGTLRLFIRLAKPPLTFSKSLTSHELLNVIADVMIPIHFALYVYFSCLTTFVASIQAFLFSTKY